MKLRTLLFLAVTFGLTLSAHADWGRRHTEPYHLDGTFSPQGEITVENINGRITIETWDRDAFVVEGEKRAKSAEDLELIEILSDVDGNHLSLRVKLHKKKGWFKWGNVDGQVDFTLKIPATARVKNISTVNGKLLVTGLRGHLRASSVNGGIEANDLGGNAHIRTVNGGVKARFSAIDADAELRFETVNGGVSVTLPEEVGVTVSGSVVNGHIDCDMPIMMKGRIGKKTLNGTIGDGRARLDVSTVNGSIKIRASES